MDMQRVDREEIEGKKNRELKKIKQNLVLRKRSTKEKKRNNKRRKRKKHTLIKEKLKLMIES